VSPEAAHLVSVGRALIHSSKYVAASDVWQLQQGPLGSCVCLQLFRSQAGALPPCRAQAEEHFSTSEGVMMWEILVLKVFLSQYFYVREDLISRGACNGRCCAPGSCWKRWIPTPDTTLVHGGINPEPSCSSPGAISWPWLLQSQTKLRK